MGSKRTTFLALDDSSLLAVLNCQRELGYLDILRISRCCKRLHALCQAELLWKSQYQAVYGHAEDHAGVCFRQFFKDRSMHDAAEQRMKRRLQRYRLQSDINKMQRELKQLQSQLEREKQEQTRISRELNQLQHAKQVQSVPSQLFHLSAVKLYHNQVVQAAPVSLAAELSNLQQQQRVSQLELKTLQAGIQSRQQLIKKHTRQLAALEG